MVRLTVLPPAESDLQNAKTWYAQAGLRLSSDFIMCVEDALARIKRNPLGFPLLDSRIRRAIVHRFPYNIMFFLEPDHVYVIGVLHQRRHPLHWQQRIH